MRSFAGCGDQEHRHNPERGAAGCCRARGMGERFTVRPQGHPYNRTAELPPSRWLRSESGLHAGRALRLWMKAGIKRIVISGGGGSAGAGRSAKRKDCIVSSHAPNVDTLCAENAAQRWQRFRCIPAGREARRPGEAVEFIGGGQWRSRGLPERVRMARCMDQL